MVATPQVESATNFPATVHSITTNEDAAANANVKDNDGMTDNFDASKPSAEAAIASETDRVQPPKSPDMEADDVSAEAASPTAEKPIPLTRK